MRPLELLLLNKAKNGGGGGGSEYIPPTRQVIVHNYSSREIKIVVPIGEMSVTYTLVTNETNIIELPVYKISNGSSYELNCLMIIGQRMNLPMIDLKVTSPSFITNLKNINGSTYALTEYGNTTLYNAFYLQIYDLSDDASSGELTIEDNNDVE